MKETKLISIVVTYNGARWIKWCLNSLISSSLPTEVIVVDNKSVDSTTEIIKSNYPQVQLVEVDHNMGFGKANNIGLRIALDLNADYIFLLNQDACVKTNTLRELIVAHKGNKEYGILSPLHLTGDGNLLDDYFSRYLMSSRIGGFELISQKVIGRATKDIYPVKFVNAAAWLVSKQCLNVIGGFDPLFPHYGEDNNYINRVHYHSLKVGVVPCAVAYHDRENRGRETGMAINPFKQELDILRRSLLVKALNPNQPANIKQIKTYLLKRIYQSIMKFNYKNILLQIDVFKEFSSKVEIIQNHRERFKLKERTFLE